jgi:hypothetical protein
MGPFRYDMLHTGPGVSDVPEEFAPGSPEENGSSSGRGAHEQDHRKIILW